MEYSKVTPKLVERWVGVQGAAMRRMALAGNFAGIQTEQQKATAFFDRLMKERPGSTGQIARDFGAFLKAENDYSKGDKQKYLGLMQEFSRNYTEALNIISQSAVARQADAMAELKMLHNLGNRVF